MLFGVGSSLVGIGFGLLVYPLPVSRRRKQKWTRSSIHGATWTYVRVMRSLGLLNFRIDPAVRKHTEGRLIIANHPSLLDVVFILSAIPDMNCIVKAALWRNPFTFAVVTMAGYIRNDAEDLIEVAAEKMKNGEKLIIFPEGTRTVDPAALDFKRGGAHIALAAGQPIKPIFITCKPSTLRKHEKWYDVPDAPPLFTLTALSDILISECIDTTRPKPVQVRHLTRYLQGRFQKLVNIDNDLTTDRISESNLPMV